MEVHQQGNNSSDIVFGVRLDAVVLTNSPTSAGIVINEVLANNQSFTNLDGTVSDWVELRNPSNADVDLAGMSLTDQIDESRRWVFPARSVISRGRLPPRALRSQHARDHQCRDEPGIRASV